MPSNGRPASISPRVIASPSCTACTRASSIISPIAVPGRNDRYYQIPFGLHWSEVTASCFMEVSWEGKLLRGEGEIERSCYAIHAPIHRKLPGHANAVFHTHMPFASALTRLKDPKIKPIGQTEVIMMRKTGYDMDYHGPAFDQEEGERLGRSDRRQEGAVHG